MNKVILKGRLTAGPELKNAGVNSIPVAEFSVAVNRRFNKEQADFISCQAWRNTAEFITKYFKKGQEIAVVGELHIDKYEKDGEPRYSTRVVVDEVEFCGSKADNNSHDEDTSAEPPQLPFTGDDDGLPF
jgi:single-strand DNA-binding protein